MRYRDDPRELTTKYAGTCATCGKPVPRGARVVYWPKARKVICWPCGESDLRHSLAAMADEDFGNCCL